MNGLSHSSDAGDLSLSTGREFPKISVKVPSPLRWLRNNMGVRAQIPRLILTPSGHQAIQKLARLLGREALFGEVHRSLR